MSDLCNDSSETEEAIIGPVLPKHLLNKNNLTNCSDQEPVNNIIGPALPPHLLDNTNRQDEDELQDPSTNQSTSSSINNSYGPSLPPHLLSATANVDSEDEDEYGPLPPGISSSSNVHRALEERALQIKLGHFSADLADTKSREEWMIELPQIKAGSLGLGARQFRKNERPDFSDRSSWTDTPEQKLKKSQGKVEQKVDLKKEAEKEEIIKRDREQSKLVEKHNKKKKRDKSLLEIHQDKVKKKKEEDSKDGIPTRRPFNREIDLKVNQFDDAQKKSIMKKAMHLDDRFSRGQSKFL